METIEDLSYKNSKYLTRIGLLMMELERVFIQTFGDIGETLPGSEDNVSLKKRRAAGGDRSGGTRSVFGRSESGQSEVNTSGSNVIEGGLGGNLLSHAGHEHATRSARVREKKM
jgi:hypothetical protein